MKAINFYFVQFLLVFLCLACEEDQAPVESLGPIKKNYVAIYAINIDSVTFSFDKDWNKGDKDWQGDCSGALIATTHGEEYRQWISEEKDIHSKYATLYGDTTFNQPASSCFTGGCNTDTVKLSVLCDKSYNKTHVAGADINHLLKVRYFSAKEAIQNNYFKDKYKYLDVIPYHLRLDSLNMKENYLLGEHFAFSFLEAPDNSGEYTFTFVYEGNNGKRIEKQSEPVYLEGKD